MSDQDVSGGGSYENLANISFGERYSDELTQFSGVATSRCISVDQPEMIHIENEQSNRWIPANRLVDSSGTPVLSVEEETATATS